MIESGSVIGEDDAMMRTANGEFGGGALKRGDPVFSLPPSTYKAEDPIVEFREEIFSLAE